MFHQLDALHGLKVIQGHWIRNGRIQRPLSDL